MPVVGSPDYIAEDFRCRPLETGLDMVRNQNRCCSHSASEHVEGPLAVHRFSYCVLVMPSDSFTTILSYGLSYSTNCRISMRTRSDPIHERSELSIS